MTVDAVFLVGQHVIFVQHKKVRHLRVGRGNQRACRVVAVKLDHAAVTGGIRDIKMVVAAAGGKHIVLLQQFDGFGGGGGAVQHQPDSHGGGQHRLACILFGRLAVQCQHGDRHALFVDTVQASERGQQAGNLALGAGVGLFDAQIIQRGKRDGLIAVLGRGADQHGRGITLKVVVATHQVVAVRGLRAERTAPEAGRFDGDGQQRQRLLDGFVDEALVVGSGVGDHFVQVVVIADLHAVEVVIVVVGQFNDGVGSADAAGIQRAEADGGYGHNSQRPQSDTGGKLHNGSLLFVDRRILLILVDYVGGDPLHCSPLYAKCIIVFCICARYRAQVWRDTQKKA